MTNTMQNAAPPTPHEAVREGLREVQASEKVTKLAEQVIAHRERTSAKNGK